ncbi:MAG: shikimate kinase [Acidobacteriota bacterium]
MRVFLTGFMGAGKTSVGRPLADRLGVSFFDLDQEVERQAGRSVQRIFDQEGEDGFRRLELAAVEQLLDEPKLVLATGGGTLTREPARRRIEQAGWVVWLDPPFTTLMERLSQTNSEDRPLFQGEGPARRLYESRLEVYRRCDLRVEVRPTEQPEEVAARIEQWVARRASEQS